MARHKQISILTPTDEPAVEAPPPPAEKFYRVAKECRVPQGASYYTLPAGKVISSKGYDIGLLQSIGVPLEPHDGGLTAMRATVIP